MADVRRTVYARHLDAPGVADNLPLPAAASLCAFAGAFVGSRLLVKMTIDALHHLVGTLLPILAGLLASGIIQKHRLLTLTWNFNYISVAFDNVCCVFRLLADGAIVPLRNRPCYGYAPRSLG